jgi:hypothetical protein
MKLTAWLAIAALLALAACSSAPKPAASGSALGASAPLASADTGSDLGMPVPPPGAMFTLFCCAFTGPTHIADAAQAKQYLIARTGLKDWYIIHSEGESDLYYGFYTTFDDPAQTAEFTRAQDDHAKLTSLVNDVGDKIFSMVLFVPINLPDPPAPKEWDLKNNPGYWTLQIGIYRDSPQRKQAAVDAVREARAQGIEAYYQHGPVASGVFVGSWPKEAAEISDTSAPTEDPHQPVLVLSSPIAGHEGQDYQTTDGREVHVVMPAVQLFDPTLKDAVAKYPYTEINGEILGRASPRHPDVIPYPSYLIPVPHEDVTPDKDQLPGMTPDQNQPDQPAQPSQPDQPMQPNPPDQPADGQH